MHTHDRTSRFLATGLSLLAGYVDALGFMALGGLFVSFMSGNSTRFSVGLAESSPLISALLPLGIIILFVIGVIAGKYIRHYRPHSPSTSLLAFMFCSLFLGALFAQAGYMLAAIPFMAFAMGAANNVFVREGEVSIGVTYMTGTLVKLGQRLAGRWIGEQDSHWKPYFLLWCSLILGAFAGATCFHYFQLSALWGSSLLCFLLIFMARKLDAQTKMH